MTTKSHKKYLLALLIPMLMHQAVADDTTTDLGTLKVTTKKAKPQGKLGEVILNRTQLNQQNIQNAQDLVRYNTEVDVAEVGRYGNKGFAIRGVDGNRVAMNIDGVALPEIESNELYSPYGYNYEGRFNPDLQLMGGVRIQAGADSLTSGSGAVGGSVSYRTKSPSDLLKNGQKLGGYVKVGYTNKNEELLTAVGIAGRVGKFEGLLDYAHRDGHELKNYDMRKHSKERLNSLTYAEEHKYSEIGGCYINEYGQEKGCGTASASLYPDSSHYKSDAVLGKFFYQATDAHRFGLHGMYQTKDTFSQLTSKNLYGGAKYSTDSEEMKMFGASYRYTPTSRWLDEITLNYTKQKILGSAYTDTQIYTDWGFVQFMTYLPIEYRPTTMDTDQYRLETRLAPLEFGKLGEHQLSLTSNYNKMDYTATKVAYKRDGDGVIQYAYQPDLIPFPDAKKDNFNLTLSDKIYFNDRFNALLGVRYDYYKYAPYFQNITYQPDETGNSNETTTIEKRAKTDTVLAFYKNYRNGVYNEKPTFDKVTYGGQFELVAIPNRFNARYKVGTGFLAPTITQMYSAFQGQQVQQIINTNLKPETSLNQELEFEFNFNPFMLTLSAYRSDYKNFIHSKWWPVEASVNSDCYKGSTTTHCIQSINLDDAKVEGYKVGLRADLSRYLHNNDRMYFTADYHTAKDEATYKADKEIDGTLTINTLAAVPTTLIFGLDYHLPDDKATFHLKARHLHGKKAEDTKMVEVYYPEGSSSYRERVATYKYIGFSKNALVLDAYGTYKFGKNLSINAGVYNLLNKKYIPWDSLRQFANTNINAHIGGENAYGMNRYTAPGRNYAIAVTYEF